MKKYIVLVLLSILLIGILSGCTEQQPKDVIIFTGTAIHYEERGDWWHDKHYIVYFSDGNSYNITKGFGLIIFHKEGKFFLHLYNEQRWVVDKVDYSLEENT